MKNCECIRLEETNITLRKTFEFIKNHPVYTNGKKTSTIINMKTSILQIESNLNLTPYNVATNTIYGNVVEVYDTLVKLEYINSSNQKIPYIISYDSIISIIDESTNEYHEQYLRYMERLPCICQSCDNKYNDLNKIKDSQNISVIFLIDGALTREFRVENVELVKNLILLESFIIIPITKISGFIYNSTCEAKSKILSYNSKSLWK